MLNKHSVFVLRIQSQTPIMECDYGQDHELVWILDQSLDALLDSQGAKLPTIFYKYIQIQVELANKLHHQYNFDLFPVK